MRISKILLKQNLALLLIVGLFFNLPALAATDLEAQQGFARALAKNHQKNPNHASHENSSDKSLDFRGIFYGFLPCKDCTGIKATLSLKQNNNYLLVTQPAKESSREFYEKGKYSWNDKDQTVVLTPRAGSTTRYYRIENEGTLIQMNDNGTRMVNQSDRYTLKRSDMAKSREVHIH